MIWHVWLCACMHIWGVCACVCWRGEGGLAVSGTHRGRVWTLLSMSHLLLAVGLFRYKGLSPAHTAAGACNEIDMLKCFFYNTLLWSLLIEPFLDCSSIQKDKSIIDHMSAMSGIMNESWSVFKEKLFALFITLPFSKLYVINLYYACIMSAYFLDGLYNRCSEGTGYPRQSPIHSNEHLLTTSVWRKHISDFVRTF